MGTGGGREQIWQFGIRWATCNLSVCTIGWRDGCRGLASLAPYAHTPNTPALSGVGGCGCGRWQWQFSGGWKVNERPILSQSVDSIHCSLGACDQGGANDTHCASSWQALAFIPQWQN